VLALILILISPFDFPSIPKLPRVQDFLRTSYPSVFHFGTYLSPVLSNKSTSLVLVPSTTAVLSCEAGVTTCPRHKTSYILLFSPGRTIIVDVGKTFREQVSNLNPIRLRKHETEGGGIFHAKGSAGIDNLSMITLDFETNRRFGCSESSTSATSTEF
jgi:hypothetical protein